MKKGLGLGVLPLGVEVAGQDVVARSRAEVVLAQDPPEDLPDAAEQRLGLGVTSLLVELRGLLGPPDRRRQVGLVPRGRPANRVQVCSLIRALTVSQ